MSLIVANVANDQPDTPTEPPKSETELTIDLDSGLEVKVVCKNCGSWRRVPPDTFMLGELRCVICGSVMTPEPEDDNPDGGQPPDQPKAEPTDLSVDLAPTDQPLTEPTVTKPVEASTKENDARYIDTEAWIDQWWQEVSAQGDQPAQICPDCGSALDGNNACSTCGFPNEPLRRRIGRVMMAIAKALRARHPTCRKTPCAQCRQVVAKMNAFVVSDDLYGLIRLWREVTDNGDQTPLSP